MRSIQYRVILRLAWATTGLYMPLHQSNLSRALALEVLPRCLSVRVARKPVLLPDPFFHVGQAQKLGHRLRFSIDITNRIPIRANNTVRDRTVEIELSWLHAPLEDHAFDLLEPIGSGTCMPVLNHLINLPLIQVTLDRVQTVGQFVDEISSAVFGKPQPEFHSVPENVPLVTPDALIGTYTLCHANERVIEVSTTLAMIKSKLSSQDDLQCDDWIPVSLRCPLTLTRMELPVRSVNCDHLQCFDLASYLTINKRRPRWCCPVCSSPAPFRDLMRDDFFLQLLSDEALTDTDQVQVGVAGLWKKGFLSNDVSVLSHCNAYNDSDHVVNPFEMEADSSHHSSDADTLPTLSADEESAPMPMEPPLTTDQSELQAYRQSNLQLDTISQSNDFVDLTEVSDDESTQAPGSQSGETAPPTPRNPSPSFALSRRHQKVVQALVASPVTIPSNNIARPSNRTITSGKSPLSLHNFRDLTPISNQDSSISGSSEVFPKSLSGVISESRVSEQTSQASPTKSSSRFKVTSKRRCQ